VVCCPEGEDHEIPADMVCQVLRSYGWPAEQLGGEVDAAELRGYLSRRRPAALLVSCTTPCGLAGAARAIDTAHDVGVPVMVGGAAFGRDDLRALRLGAAAWAPTVKAAVSTLEEWAQKPPQVSPGRALTDSYLNFEAAMPEIAARAMEALRHSGLRRSEDVADMAPAYDRIQLMLRYLGAALLVDDGRLFLDYLSWRVAFLRARDVGSERLAAGLSAVAEALPAQAGQVRRFVDDGLQHLEWSGSSSTRSWKPRTEPVGVGQADTGQAREGYGSADTDLAGSGQTDSAAGTVRALSGPDVQQGQIFSDLLFVAAVTCHAPMALISVLQADGQWSTLSYGVERREALTEPSLFAAIANSPEPLHTKDLSRHEGLTGSPLATGPLAVRHVYGVPLRSRQNATLGVLCILDRRTRMLSQREQQAVLAIARQVAAQIVLWRRSSGTEQQAGPHPADRRHSLSRSGPDAALADLLGVRRAGVEQHLLRSHEVAVLFDVTERTVINWAASNKLSSLRTAGGHLRFRSEDVLALLAGRSKRSG
jgi:excisionase family DNA binding protein